jgi:hypothetical protein
VPPSPPAWGQCYDFVVLFLPEQVLKMLAIFFL